MVDVVNSIGLIGPLNVKATNVANERRRCWPFVVVRRCFVASLLRCFVASLLRCFVTFDGESQRMIAAVGVVGGVVGGGGNAWRRE